jgi:hypothetical protein
MESMTQTVHGRAFGAQVDNGATRATQPLFGRTLTMGEAMLGGATPPLAMSELYDISRKSAEGFQRTPSGSSLAASDQGSASSSSSQTSRAPLLTNKAKFLLRMADQKRC